MVEVMKIVATSFKWSHAGTTALSAPSLQKATTNPRLHWTWLDTHRQVWVSLLWGTPETAPYSRAEGLLFLHGLESNPGSSLQTEEEAGLP